MISQAYFDKIKTFFNGDTAKAWVWWKTPNPGFGMLTPMDMLRTGREAKVKQFIDNALKGYYP